ncbi:hypothetical protein BLOT_009349 [Blomia tropicalis]|nr:hypothetical protein BLOT_009349 [Blomia tropicalis]
MFVFVNEQISYLKTKIDVQCMVNHNNKLTGMAIELSEYDFDVNHVKQLYKDNMKKDYDKRNATRYDDTEVGSNILVVHKKKLSSKLNAKFKGPFLVIEKLGPVTYLVKDSENKTMKVHRDQMLKIDLDQLSLIRAFQLAIVVDGYSTKKRGLLHLALKMLMLFNHNNVLTLSLNQ